MKCPCLTCEHLLEDKNNEICANCKARIAYYRHTGQPEAPPTTKTIKKEDKPMPSVKVNLPTSCPFGLNFGIDYDTKPECDDCDDFSCEECRKLHYKTPDPVGLALKPVKKGPGQSPPKHPATIPAKQTVKIPKLVAPEPEAVPRVKLETEDLDLSKWKRIEFDQRYFSTPTMGVRDESLSFNASAVKDFNLQKFTCLEIFHHQNRLAMIPTNTETQFRLKFNKSYCVVTSRRLIRHLKLKPGKHPIQNIGGRMLVEVETL